MKKYNFVYITTNLINGKQYIGDHSTNNLEDNYIGSGKPLFKNAKRKYGIKNFDTRILEFFGTKEESFNAQEKYILEYNTLHPNGYNLSPKGGIGIKNGLSKESIEKIRKANKGKEPPNKGKKGLYSHSDETLQKMKTADRSKWHLSEEGRENISKSMSKRLKGIAITEEHKENIKKNSSRYWKDKSLSTEHKDKLRLSHMGKKQKRVICEHCNKEIAVNIYSRFHGDKCKKIKY